MIFLRTTKSRLVSIKISLVFPEYFAYPRLQYLIFICEIGDFLAKPPKQIETFAEGAIFLLKKSTYGLTKVVKEFSKVFKAFCEKIQVILVIVARKLLKLDSARVSPQPIK